MVLNSEPTGDVVVPLSSNDTTEGTVSAASLTFTPVNWNAPQTVTLTGVDDALADGSPIYSVVTAGGDERGQRLSRHRSPQRPGVQHRRRQRGVHGHRGRPLTTTEAGGQAMFTVVLNSQPAADVTIPLPPATPARGPPARPP